MFTKKAISLVIGFRDQQKTINNLDRSCFILSVFELELRKEAIQHANDYLL